MSKEHVAYNRFRDNIRWWQENTSLKIYFENNNLHLKEDLDTIETSLKRLEGLNKVLMILQERSINLEYLKDCETYEEYHRLNRFFVNGITENEFNLLKEYLNE